MQKREDRYKRRKEFKNKPVFIHRGEPGQKMMKKAYLHKIGKRG